VSTVMMIFALLGLPESPVWSRSALPPQAIEHGFQYCYLERLLPRGHVAAR
jgi:hypothetical protein